MRDENDKNHWVIDDEAAAVVRRIFKLCIDGYGPSQIARMLSEDNILIPSAYAESKGHTSSHSFKKPTRWCNKTVESILEKPEYIGHTVNFRTHVKSYKNKKRINNNRTEWAIFENTHDPIISQHDYDLVQELRRHKYRPQKSDKVNPFSGMVYCADCGKKMYLCRSRCLSEDQEHLKCSTYANDKEECSAHFIRTAVLRQILISEINRIIEKIVVHASDKSSGHRKQQIDIYYRFSIGISSVQIDSRDFDKKLRQHSRLDGAVL